MKKLVTLALLASTVVFAGCSVDWNDEQGKKIADLESKIARNEIENQEKCGRLSKELFVTFRFDMNEALKTGFWDTAHSSFDYENHFNSTKWKCYATISELTTYSDHIEDSKWVYDVLENKALWWIIASGQKVYSCHIWDEKCSTESEFLNLSRQFTE